MNSRSHLPTSLSAAEWEVMKVLWDHGPLPARDVYARLPKDHGWAYKTVKTLLARLVAKEALTYQQIGNSFLYQAAADRTRLTRSEVRSVFRRLISAASSPVLAQFIEEADLSADEIRHLKKLLDEKRRNTNH